ncbi:acyl-CoA dehydrogenase family protein [Streptomyces sp. 4F14]|uniref:acyl-CoA dehydrogenase family protein n=1 Tax=Streptomyces sp. 4F14 TaxID=3394380 RepID=UPI003A87CE75
MTADADAPGPTASDELVVKAHELIPFLRSHSESSERACTLAPEVVTTLRDAGFFRLTTPAKFGGHDLSLSAQTEVIAAVSRGCASAGWVVAAEAASTMLVHVVSEAAMAEAFDGRPDTLMLSTAVDLTRSTATPAEGGFLLSGYCRFATGAEISDWALVTGAAFKAGDEDRVLSCVLPMSDVTVERTWHMSGMNGTGTHAIVLDDVFVPEHRTRQFLVSEVLASDEDERPSYFVRASLTTLAALVGAARGARDVVREKFSKDPAETDRPTDFRGDAAMESPGIRLWFAEAAHLIDSSMLHLTHAAGRLDGIGYEDPVPWLERAELRMHAASSVRLARDGMEKLLDISGARGFALANPLQRYWRDLAVGSRHVSFHAPTALEDYSLALWNKRPSLVLI